MEWHYGVANTVHGPVFDEDLLELVRDKTVRPDTLVWAPYLVEWAPAEEIEGLFEAAGVKISAEVLAGAEKGTESPWATPSTAPLGKPVSAAKLSQKKPSPKPSLSAPPKAVADKPTPKRVKSKLPPKRKSSLPKGRGGSGTTTLAKLPKSATSSRPKPATGPILSPATGELVKKAAESVFSTNPLPDPKAKPAPDPTLPNQSSEPASKPEPAQSKKPKTVATERPEPVSGASDPVVPAPSEHSQSAALAKLDQIPEVPVAVSVAPRESAPIPQPVPTASVQNPAPNPEVSVPVPPPIPEAFATPNLSGLAGEPVPSPFTSVAFAPPPESPQNEIPPPKDSPFPVSPPTKVQRGKSGVTGALGSPSAVAASPFSPPPTTREPQPGLPETKEKAAVAEPEADSGAGDPVRPTSSFSGDWKRPDEPSPKRRSRPIPALAKVGLLLALSAASAFGVHTYRNSVADSDRPGMGVPEIDETPELPPPAPERSLSEHFAHWFPSAPGEVVVWNLGRAQSMPRWIGSADPNLLIDLLRDPAPLAPWILESDPEAAIVAETEAAGFPEHVAFVRYAKSDPAALAGRFTPVEGDPLSDGKKLVRPTSGSTPGAPSAASDQAAIFLDPFTIVTAHPATLRALFENSENRSGSPTDAPSSSAWPPLDSLPGTATVAIVTPAPGTAKATPPLDTPDSGAPESAPDGKSITSGAWHVTLLAADSKLLTYEEVVLGSDGKPVTEGSSKAAHDPDTLFGRVLFSGEIAALEKVKRYASPSIRGSRFTAIPKEVLLGEIVDLADPDAEVADLTRYLPDRYRAVASYDLKKIRENPQFEAFRNGSSPRPYYWRELDVMSFGLQSRDLDRLISCSALEGTVHILRARFELGERTFENAVNLSAGYSVKGLDLYPVLPRTPESPYLCIVDKRTAIIGPGAMLERIIRNEGGASPSQAYMTELYPEMGGFEKSVMLRVEGRTADGRYQGVQALFFGESLHADGYDSRRIVKCRTPEMAEEFNRTMRRRREDAASAGVGTSVAELVTVGMNGGQLVIGSQIPVSLWEAYAAYFKNVILPEGS